MSTKFTTGVLLTAALLTAACSQGERMYHTFTMPDGEKATIVDHQNHFPQWMVIGYPQSYIIEGDEPTKKQLAALDVVEGVCEDHVRTVHPHNSVTLVVDAALFGAAGAAGGAIGSLAFPFAKASQYAMYGAASGGLFGMAYGGFTISGKNYTFQSCSREVFARFPKYKVQPIIDSYIP